MSRKAKEAVILLINIGKNVEQCHQDGKSFLTKSKECASKIIQRKIFSDSSDEFSVILMGSKATSNELDYPNILVVNKWLTMPNWEMVKSVEDLSPTDIETADWLDTLIVAINILKTESDCKNLTALKIVMMSNVTAPVRCEDQVDAVIESLKQLNISLVVIGQTPEEYENLNGVIKSENERNGEEMISRIIDETEGVMCDFNEAMTQLDHFKKVVAKAAPWYCDLQIGENIFIPVAGFKKYSPKTWMKWKKRSIDKGSVIEDVVYFEGDQQVDKSDVINSYLFGLTVVPISGEDKTSMALTTEKCLQLIGFTKKQNVPRQIFMGDSAYYVVPRQEVEGAMLAVTALVKALIDLEMVAVVRRVYCKNSSPQIGALIPACEEKSYFFYYVVLPFAEDERITALPSLKHVKASHEQLDIVGKLIDDMDLTQYEEEEDPWSKLIDPSVEHKNNCIIFKALHPDSQLPKKPVEAITKLLQPKLDSLECISDTLDMIQQTFSLEEIQQKNYRKVASEFFDRPQDNGSDEQQDDVKPSNDAIVQAMTSFCQSTVTEIGTVDPKGNFLMLLESGVQFDKLCDEMQNSIRSIFLISNNAATVNKALSALSLLRKQCVSQNPHNYNKFIASLKDDFVERGHDEFWNSVTQEKLGLITSEETKESNVTPEDADIFYNLKKTDFNKTMDEHELEEEELLDMI